MTKRYKLNLPIDIELYSTLCILSVTLSFTSAVITFNKDGNAPENVSAMAPVTIRSYTVNCRRKIVPCLSCPRYTS